MFRTALQQGRTQQAGETIGRAASGPYKQEFLVPFILLLAGYCAWVLSLPIFPSLDGSLHLYYASVLGSLLSGSKVFSSYYFIRHILPPYALHYYFLIAAAHFFGYVMADKLLVCLIFIVTAFGFRYLAGELGPSGGWLSLLAIPLILNWPLGMGFYNYCLAIGMALWALGLWYRAARLRSHRLWIGFLVVVILMVLTHPVPTLLVYVLVGIDVAWRLWKKDRLSGVRGQRANHAVRSFRWDMFYMLAAWCTFLYIAQFIGAHRVLGNLTQAYPRKIELLRLAKLSTLAMFSGSQPAVLLYRLSLYAILIVAIALATGGVAAHWRREENGTPRVLFVCSILLLALVPVLPPVMNGANYFAQRLMVLIWIGMLAAACGYSGMSKRSRSWAAICVFAYGVGVLAFANMRIRPVAARISQIENGPTIQRPMPGLALGLPDAPDPADLNYVPYYWAAARYFRRTNSTLLNGGWLYQYYLPLGSRLDEMTDMFTPAIQDSPGNAFQLLMKSPEARRQVMPHSQLVVFTGQATASELAKIMGVLDGWETSRRWTCNVQAWYSVCIAPLIKKTQ